MPKTILLICLLCCQQFLFAQITGRNPFSIGESLELTSQILGESRTVNIYLPESYKRDSAQEYPVIYLLDGSRDEDFVHVAGLVQFCSFSWVDIIPESIVAGIGNVDRKRDFTYPTSNKQDKEDFPTTGGSANFIKFLETELQPLIAQTYRISSTRTLIGQSLGGLLATEILFKKPELFDNYIIISPSLWWDDESLLAFEVKKELTAKHIYVGVGKEGKIMERVAQELYQKLQTGQVNGTRLFYGYFEKQDHADALHLSVYDAFERIFEKEEEESQD